jgi:hypothetical protein
MKKIVISLVIISLVIFSLGIDVCPSASTPDPYGLKDRAELIARIAEGARTFTATLDTNFEFILETDDFRDNCQNFQLEVFFDNKDGKSSNSITQIPDTSITLDRSGIDLETIITLTPDEFDALGCLQSTSPTGEKLFICEMKLEYSDTVEKQVYLTLYATITVEMSQVDPTQKTPAIKVSARSDHICDCRLVYDVPVDVKMFKDDTLTDKYDESDNVYLFVGDTVFFHVYLEHTDHIGMYTLDLETFQITYGPNNEALDYSKAVRTAPYTGVEEGLVITVVLPAVVDPFQFSVVTLLKDKTRRRMEDDLPDGVLAETKSYPSFHPDPNPIEWWVYFVLCICLIIACAASIAGMRKCRKNKKLCWKEKKGQKPISETSPATPSHEEDTKHHVDDCCVSICDEKH